MYVAEIWRYPVKSMAFEHLQSAHADSGAIGPLIPVGSGPRFRWEMVQDSGGKWSRPEWWTTYRNGGPHGPERWTRSPESDS